MSKREPITYEDLNQVMNAFKNNECEIDHKEENKKKRVNFIVGLLMLLHLR